MARILDRDVTVRAIPAAEGVRFEYGTATACAVRNRRRDITVRVVQRDHTLRNIFERIPLLRGVARLFGAISALPGAISESAQLKPRSAYRGSAFTREFARLFQMRPQSIAAFGTALLIPVILLALFMGMPAMIEAVLAGHSSEHMVYPKMVYISDSTEIGTIYTKAELVALRECCDKHDLLLFLDGARLGSALTSPANDLTLQDIAALTDMFYIGGTKNGLLFGEALVVNTPNPHFRWHMKQRGAVLAKGRLLGVQYKALMSNNLFFDIARHANEMAQRLHDGMAALGYTFPVEAPSNQQFPLMANTTVKQLADMGYEFEPQDAVDADHTIIRFVTSWATPVEAVDQFLKDLASCK